MKNISLYISYHNKSDLIKTECFKPIQVGTKNHTLLFPLELHDASGDNISHKNKSFCELTAQYWVWKNDLTSDYIGFCHYRRHFVLNPNNTTKSNIYGVIPFDKIDDEYLKKVGYSDHALEQYLKRVDVVTPEKWDVRNLYAKNNLEQYEKGENLDINDYHLCLNILKKKYPEYTQAAVHYNKSVYGYYTNMFIMKRAIFLHYSAWLFDILFELEKKVDLSNKNIQEYRVFGYISEWLFGIYITHLMEKKNFNIKECRRTFIHNIHTGKYSLSPKQPNLIAKQEDNFITNLKVKFKKIVPIVTAFNENYAITGAALIQSIIENSDSACFYDIYIIEGALSNTTKFNFQFMFRNLENFKINIIDADPYFEKKQLNLHAHFSKETYYRILIPTLLPQYNKVIYLDADMVVNTDIQLLYDTDIGHKSVAAVKDYVMRGFIKNEITCEGKYGYLTAEEYLKQYIGMKNPHHYVQAGVLIFNTEKIRKTGKDQLILQEIDKKNYWFLDQDLLNKHFENDIYYLETNWNVLHGNNNIETFYKNLPLEIMENYFKARKDPWIIHFAGEQKPWLNPLIDFAGIFFYYLRNTPWLHYANISYTSSTNLKSLYSNKKLIVKNTLRTLANKFLPIGTKRRKLAYKFYRMASTK